MLLLTRTTPFEQVTKKNRRHEPVLRRASTRQRSKFASSEKLGRAAVDTNLLFIDNLKVSASDLIGGEGRRLSIACSTG